jgi:tetratricopeptide (TPR) repeat protein
MKYIAFLFCFLPSVVFALPAERKDIRKGNKDYKKGDYAAAEIDYRRALDKVAESANAKYNLGNALLKQLDSAALQNPNAKKQLQEIRDYYTPLAETGADAQLRANAHFNIGNTYLIEQDWKKAVEAYKQTLRLNPADMAAKENLVFAQAMSQNPQQQQQQQQQNQDNRDKQDDENKQPQDQQKDKQQEQNKQDENQEEKQQDQQQQQQEEQPNISKDDAQRMLQAIEQQEKETQDKVKKEKAKKAKTRSSDKNW